VAIPLAPARAPAGDRQYSETVCGTATTAIVVMLRKNQFTGEQARVSLQGNAD